MARASNNGREDGTRSVISCEARLAHSRAIVNHQCSNFVVTHFVLVSWLFWNRNKKKKMYNQSVVTNKNLSTDLVGHD
jgi:hypothetical protein